MEGLIFNIQRFSTKDGPGIRTTVFFKGCNVNCAWCHNPESIDGTPVLKFDSRLCSSCLACVAACDLEAVSEQKGERVYEPEKCILCGDCVKACGMNALEIVGKNYTEEELFSTLLKDEDYYQESGGGVTFSGGEPLLQIDFLTSLLKQLKAQGIHSAVDTALNVEWDFIERILPYTDLILLDIKGMNSLAHMDNTDVGNKLIHSNAARLAGADVEIIVRMPLVKDLNDKPEEIHAAANFIKNWKNLTGVELLAYHSLGVDKSGEYAALKAQDKFMAPDPEFMQDAAEIFKRAGIKVVE